MKYSIEKVENKKQINDFIRMPWKIYAGNPCYVPDMEMDIREMITPKKEDASKDSVIQPFIAYDANRQAVGRVVGIINHKANKIWNTLTVRFGMIEFIDDEELSAALLHAVEQWGKTFGMNKLEGPMGVTDFDKEGMLLEDFDKVGSAVTLYNPPYYPQHMEKHGLEKEADWVQMRIEVPDEIPARFTRVAKLTAEMNNLKVRKLTKRELMQGGYVYKIFDLLNECYKPLFGFAALTHEQCQTFIKQYLMLLDMRMLPVIEDPEGKVVGVAVTIGSLTNALQKSKGRLLPFGWCHLLKSIKLKHEDKVELLLIGIHPDYQGLGVNALVFDDLIRIYKELGYKWVETGPMLENNQKVLTQWKSLNPTIYKRRRCFCRLIQE